jgi:hypothetical protein
LRSLELTVNVSRSPSLVRSDAIACSGVFWCDSVPWHVF